MPKVRSCFLLFAILLIAVPGVQSVKWFQGDSGSSSPELAVVGRAVEVVGKQTRDPCIPRGRILAVIQTSKPRYNAVLSVVVVLLSNAVLAFTLFVMVATRYLRRDIRNTFGDYLKTAFAGDHASSRDREWIRQS